MSNSESPLKGPDNVTPLEQWNAHTVHQKILETLEDYEYGRINEEELAEFLLELNKRDEDHFLEKMDRYNEELRERLHKIDIAKRALEASSVVAVVTTKLDEMPDLEKSKQMALAKTMNETITNIKDPSNPEQVNTGLEKIIKQLESQQKTMKSDSAGKIQDQINALKEITMGLRADYMGSTRTSLGTGVVLQGPLGEILNLGFDKLQVEADNDGTKYIAGFITSARHELADTLKSTANYVKNSPQLNPND